MTTRLPRSHGFPPPTGRFGALLEEDKAGEGSTETPIEEPKPPTGGGGEDGVRLSRKEYDELVAARGERDLLKPKVSELEGVWQDVEAIIRSDTTPEKKSASTRKILARAKYSSEQIEDYIAQTFGQEGHSSRGKPDREGEDSAGEELRRLRGEVENDRLQSLNDRMSLHLDRALDSHPEVTKLIADVKASQGEDAATALAEVLREEVDVKTKALLRDRKAKAGRFEPSMIDATVPEAAKAIVKKYRSVMPDVSKIGKSGETDSGEDEFLATKPVPPPKYKNGMHMGTAHEQALEFTKDSLRRMSAEAGRGGSSQI